MRPIFLGQPASAHIGVANGLELFQVVPANDLIALLAQYQSRMVPVIQRHNGTIDKFLGDGIMATFGATSTSETYTADAIRAVDEVMAVADAWNAERAGEGKEPIRIGAAVATGRIVFGAVGDETRLEYTVIGDAVNVSAKLEKHTKVEKVRALATAEAYEEALAQDAKSEKKPAKEQVAPAKKKPPPKADKTVPAAPAPKAASTKTGTVKVSAFQLARKVEKRKPIDSATSFAKDEKVFAWFETEVTGGQAEVKLRWTINGKTFTGQPFAVSKSRPTWRLQPLIRVGDWKVEVLGTNDSVLHSQEFKVTEAQGS